LGRYFFDSSALAKRYHPETGSVEVERLFAEPAREIWISRLSFVETQAAFAMKVRSGFLTVEEAEMQRERLMADIASGEIEVRSMTASHFVGAEQLIRRHGLLYVFVAMEIGSRRILHVNVTDHPTAEWTIQQFREFLEYDHPYRLVIHDRDAIFSAAVDSSLKDFGISALRTPVRTPTANAFCERVIGTIRRECLDFIIPINERHLRSTVREFVAYYNRGRPHASLGPGIPEPIQASAPVAVHRNSLPVGYRISSKSILGGLHHDYRLGKEAA
jgi:hypothetical protein